MWLLENYLLYFRINLLLWIINSPYDSSQCHLLQLSNGSEHFLHDVFISSTYFSQFVWDQVALWSTDYKVNPSIAKRNWAKPRIKKIEISWYLTICYLNAISATAGDSILLLTCETSSLFISAISIIICQDISISLISLLTICQEIFSEMSRGEFDIDATP